MKDLETHEMITKTVRIPVKGVATTSNAITSDPALESGMWTLQTNPRPQLTHAVKMEKLRFRAGKRKLFPEDELKIWQCAFRLLIPEDPPESLPTVPYAETLITVLESRSTASRRDPDKLCDLISLIAYLRRFQKPKPLRDKADLVDLYFALQLGYDAITETFGELKPKELLCYETVKQASVAATVLYVADQTGIPQKSCYRLLEKVVEKGFLNKEREGRKNVYSVMPGKTPSKLIITEGSRLERPDTLMAFILESFRNFSPPHQGTDNPIFPPNLELIDPISAEQLTVTWNNDTPQIQLQPCPDEITYYPYPRDQVRRYQPSPKTTSEPPNTPSNLLPSPMISLEHSKDKIDGYFNRSQKPHLTELEDFLRANWTKGTTEDFVALAQQGGQLSEEEAQKLADGFFEQSKIAYDPDGWLVWLSRTGG